jgi:hypothetical protein
MGQKAVLQYVYNPSHSSCTMNHQAFHVHTTINVKVNRTATVYIYMTACPTKFAISCRARLFTQHHDT